jgi:hypothetical protein
VHREDGSVPNSAIARCGPASSLDMECGPPLGAPWLGRFEGAFRRFAPYPPVGARRCNLFRTLRRPLARWGSSGATPAFSALARVGTPPVAPSLLPSIIGDERPTFPGPASSLRFKPIIIKKAPCENGSDNSFAYYFVNGDVEPDSRIVAHVECGLTNKSTCATTGGSATTVPPWVSSEILKLPCRYCPSRVMSALVPPLDTVSVPLALAPEVS